MFEEFVQINPPEHPLRGRDALVSARRTWHSPHEHSLPTSIKYAISGAIDVETKRGKYRLTERSFVIVNACEPYTFTIAPGSVAQTFSLFFRPGYLPSVQASVLSGDAASLEQNPNERMTPYLEFLEAPFPSVHHDIGGRLRTLFDAWQSGASKRLLEKTEIPIGRICTQVGYSSLPSFVHLFHSRFGQSPSSFRRWRESEEDTC